MSSGTPTEVRPSVQPEAAHPAVAETRAETPRYSPNARLQEAIIRGQFPTALPEQPGQEPLPDSVHGDSTRALEAQHQQVRNTEATRITGRIGQDIPTGSQMEKDARNYISQATRIPADQITREQILQFDYMRRWGKTEGTIAAAMIQKNPDLQAAFGKLGLKGITEAELDAWLFDPKTGKPGKFYTEFAGDPSQVNARLAAALTVEDMEALRPFLKDLLVTDEAVDALIALRTSMDTAGSEEKRNGLVGSTEQSQLTERDEKVYKFFADGFAMLQPQQRSTESQPQAAVSTTTGSTNEHDSTETLSPGEGTEHTRDIGPAINSGFDDLMRHQVSTIESHLNSSNPQESAFGTGGNDDLNSALSEYGRMGGINYLPTYNITSPSWISPDFTHIPQDQIDQIPDNIRQILNNVAQADQENQQRTTPLPFDGRVNMQFSSETFQGTFPGDPPLTVEQEPIRPGAVIPGGSQQMEGGGFRLSRPVTPEDLERINTRLGNPEWEAVGITLNGSSINVAFRRKEADGTQATDTGRDQPPATLPEAEALDPSSPSDQPAS